MKDNETHHCGLYGRVSTDRQAMIRDGGLDTQFSVMDKQIEFEKARNTDAQWVIVDRYREEGWSGKNLERPEFKRLMQDIVEGRVKTVLVQKIDRITRSLQDFFSLWKTFEQYDVEFISVHEKFDTTTAVGRAMLKLILVFAELEREQTSERTTATMRHRAEQGLWNGGRRLGYDLDPDEKGVLKVNYEQARIVREHFFEKCAELGSAGRVTKHLKTAGIREPEFTSRRNTKRGGGYFSKMEVIRILTDVVYTGNVTFHEEVFQGRHEAIVADDLFNRVQEILKRNREHKGNVRDPRNHLFLLQGLIRCGRCGSVMTPKTSIGRGGKKHFYYQCTKNSHSVGTECGAKYVPAEAAEEYVLAEMRRIAMSKEQIEEIVRDTNGAKDDRLRRLNAEKRSAQHRLQEVRGKIAPLVAEIESGRRSKSLSERLDELEGDRESIDEQLLGLNQEIESVAQEVLSSEIMLESYRDLPVMLSDLENAGDRHTLKELIACFVQVIRWHQDEGDAAAGTVEIEFFEEVEPLLSCAKEHLGAATVNDGASRCNGRLPG